MFVVVAGTCQRMEDHTQKTYHCHSHEMVADAVGACCHNVGHVMEEGHNLAVVGRLPCNLGQVADFVGLVVLPGQKQS